MGIAEVHQALYGFEIECLPWGLYPDVQLDPREPCTYEDSSRLLLPVLREDTSLRRLNGRPAGHANPHQVGKNSFGPDHSSQLQHTLAIFTSHVENEQWRIDVNGVSEPTSVFEDTHAQIDPDGEEAEDVRCETVQRLSLG